MDFSGTSGYLNAQGQYVPSGSSGASTTGASTTGTTSTAGASTTSTVQPTTTSTTTTPASTPATYATVVSSKPASTDIANITNDYNNNIKPAMQQQATANQQSKQQQNANANLPVIDGYNVSATATGNAGETKATNPSTGQSYYITPQNQGTKSPSSASTGTIGTTSTTDTTGNNPTPTGTLPSNLNASGIDINAINKNYNAQIGQQQSDLDSAYQSFQSAVNQLRSGVFPLTTAQQALVDSTSQAFDAMINKQGLRAAALASATGGISTKINATLGQLSNVEADKVAAISKLELGFQTQNYNLIKDSYDAYLQSEQRKTDLLTKAHDDVVKQYTDSNDLAVKIATFNQTVYKDAAQLAQSQYEFKDKKDATGTTIGTDIFDKATGKLITSTLNSGITDPTTGITAPTVQKNADGTVDHASQQAVLNAVVPQPYRDLVWSIVNGKIEAPNTRTAAGQKLASWVAQVDPTLSDGSGGFDATKYQARLTMNKSLASTGPTSLGGALKVANTVVSHLSSFLNAASTLPKNGAASILGPNIAGFVNSGETNIIGGALSTVGNTSVQQNAAQANIIAKGLTDELTKFFKGTGGTDVSSIESWGQSLNPNAPLGSIQGTIQGGLDLFSGQFNTFLQQYKDVQGKDADISRLIQPETVATLSAFKDAGFKVDIPGIPYTDPTAYVNASPLNASELASVRAQYPNLTPSQALQLAQYNQDH